MTFTQVKCLGLKLQDQQILQKYIKCSRVSDSLPGFLFNIFNNRLFLQAFMTFLITALEVYYLFVSMRLTLPKSHTQEIMAFSPSHSSLLFYTV